MLKGLDLFSQIWFRFFLVSALPLVCMCVRVCVYAYAYVRACARACKSNCTDTTFGERTLTAPADYVGRGTSMVLKALCHDQMFDINIGSRIACSDL